MLGIVSKKKLLNSLKGEGETSHGDEEQRMGSMSLLNVVQTSGQKISSQPVRPKQDLLFLDLLLSGIKVKALVDTGATHNFISEEEAKCLGLSWEKDGSQMKVINSAVKEACGIAKSVRVTLGKWACVLDFTIVPMDDFNVILGMDSLNTSLLEEKPEGLVVPKEIARVLEEYKDVMPRELPYHLTPRRKVDHKIELEPSTRPPAKEPYRMAPKLLEELRRQLGEMLDPGLIQASKAPYGAPVLFQKKKDSNTMLEHLQHLRKGFEALQSNSLCVKKEKCSFGREEVSFLGHYTDADEFGWTKPKCKLFPSGSCQPRRGNFVVSLGC
ncbi:hypothetical protein H6P81_016215 [Aristolochia fimbriata]|uniref:Uncharacterized protein n=1 Tax=Aristolochia fimbriata TaxID=158543 RepID=A0AAV7E7L9_ARIFI|nr:hypothetical protein H6P81_016215 [Aristolochia fimbriata]